MVLIPKMLFGKYAFHFLAQISEFSSVFLNSSNQSTEIVFTVEISNFTLLLYGVQLILLPIQVGHYIIRRTDATRFRFLILSLAFITFNSLWILPSLLFNINPETGNSLLIYSGIFLVSYIYYYFLTELNISVNRHKVRQLFLSLLSVQFLREIAILNLVQKDSFFVELSFTLIFTLVAAFFSISSIQSLYKSPIKLRHALFFAAIGFFVVSTFFPLILFCTQGNYTDSIFVNAVFAMISTAYLRHYLIELRITKTVPQNTERYSKLSLSDRYLIIPSSLSSVDFTPREQEIASLILQGASYKEIALKLFVSETTVRVHSSNVFSKAGISGDKKIKQFRDKFGKSNIYQ